MYFKNIPKRVFFKHFTVFLILVVIIECVFFLLLRNILYGNVEKLAIKKSDDLNNIFSSYRVASDDEFKSNSLNYIKNFNDKNFLDVVSIDKNHNEIQSFTGLLKNFECLDKIKHQINSPYLQYVNIKNGEHVIILTRTVENKVGEIVGSISYVVSLADADITLIISSIFSLLVSLILILLLALLNWSFMRSLLTPIKEVSKTSRKIALGDFKARLTTRYDGDVGELCDTVNFMAQKLDESERMKNDFISSVSHELRTPLTAIKGWAETIQFNGEKDLEMNKKGLNIIVHEAERLCGIVEELLDFSKIQSGRMILNLEKIDILAELSEAVYMFKERALEEKKLLLYSEPEIISPVLGDKNRLRQVFINIIDNALKYTQEKGVINIGIKEENGHIEITVSDNGCGIPNEHLPKVKERFYKANTTQKGSGIGLAVVNEIVLLHSGTLEIKSEENIGTVVTISIPTVV